MTDVAHDPHAAEAEERWGDTEAYRESKRRTKAYTDSDWAEIHAQIEAIEVGLAEAMVEGVSADAERAMDLAEEARSHIDRWFYPCSPTMHTALAEMYVADGRFRAHYDDRAEGLAEYVASAIRANGARKA